MPSNPFGGAVLIIVCQALFTLSQPHLQVSRAGVNVFNLIFGGAVLINFLGCLWCAAPALPALPAHSWPVTCTCMHALHMHVTGSPTLL